MWFAFLPFLSHLHSQSFLCAVSFLDLLYCFLLQSQIMIFLYLELFHGWAVIQCFQTCSSKIFATLFTSSHCPIFSHFLFARLIFHFSSVKFFRLLLRRTLFFSWFPPILLISAIIGRWFPVYDLLLFPPVLS